MPTYKIESAARTFVGRRNNNEDSFCSDTSLGLFAVADGMGGYEGGEVASHLAIETMLGFFRRNAKDDDTTWPFGIDPRLGVEENMLAVAVRCADAEIAAKKTGKLSSMGSTVAALVVRDEHAIIGHVGDSRVYRLRGGKLTQLTRDHSLYQEMLAMGTPMPPREQFPHSNVITRALGMKPSSRPDLATEPLRAGDVFLLCTDGLTETVTEERMTEALLAMPLQDAVDRLVAEAYERGGRDNITVVAVRVKSVTEYSEP